jgi:two-component system, cell cycle sensor histidine kinase and response regulator CckA
MMRASRNKTIFSADVPITNLQTILLVEDETVVREITRQVLEHAGYRVLESNSPEQALHLANEYRGQIGLLLTDVVMPGMNGADLAQRLQAIQPDLITVFMSGYAKSDVVQTIARQSAIHIQKPFTIDTLLSHIAEALEAGSAGQSTPGLSSSAT